MANRSKQWTCQCKTQNPLSQEYCRHCGKHWAKKGKGPAKQQDPKPAAADSQWPTLQLPKGPSSSKPVQPVFLPLASQPPVQSNQQSFSGPIGSQPSVPPVGLGSVTSQVFPGQIPQPFVPPTTMPSVAEAFSQIFSHLPVQSLPAVGSDPVVTTQPPVAPVTSASEVMKQLHEVCAQNRYVMPTQIEKALMEQLTSKSMHSRLHAEANRLGKSERRINALQRTIQQSLEGWRSHIQKVKAKLMTDHQACLQVIRNSEQELIVARQELQNQQQATFELVQQMCSLSHPAEQPADQAMHMEVDGSACPQPWIAPSAENLGGHVSEVPTPGQMPVFPNIQMPNDASRVRGTIVDFDAPWIFCQHVTWISAGAPPWIFGSLSQHAYQCRHAFRVASTDVRMSLWSVSHTAANSTACVASKLLCTWSASATRAGARHSTPTAELSRTSTWKLDSTRGEAQPNRASLYGNTWPRSLSGQRAASSKNRRCPVQSDVFERIPDLIARHVEDDGASSQPVWNCNQGSRTTASSSSFRKSQQHAPSTGSAFGCKEYFKQWQQFQLDQVSNQSQAAVTTPIPVETVDGLKTPVRATTASRSAECVDVPSSPESPEVMVIPKIAKFQPGSVHDQIAPQTSPIPLEVQGMNPLDL